MDVFAEQIAELCRSERTAAKWVLVRSSRLAATLAERVVRSGTDWVNLRCQSLYHVALGMAAPYLLERGLDPTPEGLGPALMVRLLASLPSDVPGYFRPLLHQPRLGDTLWATLSELRLAGLGAADLEGDSPKLEELRALVKAYEGYLEEEKLADRAIIYREALQRIEASPTSEGDLVLPSPDSSWSALERSLIARLPGRHLSARVLDLPGLERPRRLPDWIEWVPPSGDTDALRLAWCAAPHLAPPAHHDGTVELVMAGGREAEVEDTLRRIVARQLPLDEVELAVTRPDLVAMIWEKLERHELTGTFEGGVPVQLTRPGRALCGFLRWVEGGLVAYDLRQWIAAGVVRAPADAERLLEALAPTWGRETYARALNQAIERLQMMGVEEVSDRIEELQALQAWLLRLLELVPRTEGARRPPDGRLARESEPRGGELGPWLSACRFVTDELSIADSRIDRAARKQIALALRELELLPDLLEPCRLIRERVEELTVGAGRSAPGALHVAPLAQAGWSGRRYLFGLGFEEGHFRSGTEDPVLLDHERPAVLPSSADRVTESVWDSLARLAAGAQHVSLSFSCRELRDGRKTPPSWPFFHAGRLLWPELGSQSDLTERLGNPRSVVPESQSDALSASDWWLAALRDQGPESLDRVVRSYPGLWRGTTAAQYREERGLTPYSGWVESAARLYDPRSNGKPVSASRLETLGTCPFRFFLHYLLKLKPLELQPPESGRWLDELTRGSLLHEVYAEYHRLLRKLDQKEDEASLLAMGDAQLERLRRERPPASDLQFEHERYGIHRDLRRFLELERSNERRPVGVEVSFSMPDPQGESLDRSTPVTILGNVRLLGRIDRIDLLEPHRYGVVDYKTGSDYGQDRRYRGGRKLQFALYALAALELLRELDPEAVVVSTSYYFPTERSRQAWHHRPFPDEKELERLLDELLYPTVHGVFLQTDSDDDCRLCEFKRVCGPDPHKATARKTGEARENLRRLRQHD